MGIEGVGRRWGIEEVGEEVGDRRGRGGGGDRDRRGRGGGGG